MGSGVRPTLFTRLQSPPESRSQIRDGERRKHLGLNSGEETGSYFDLNVWELIGVHSKECELCAEMEV